MFPDCIGFGKLPSFLAFKSEIVWSDEGGDPKGGRLIK